MTDRQHQIAATIAVILMFFTFGTVGIIKQSAPWLFVTVWLGIAVVVEITHWNKPRE